MGSLTFKALQLLLTCYQLFQSNYNAEHANDQSEECSDLTF